MSSQVPSNANEGCVGPSSTMAGKASSCAGCPNQKACASGKGTDVPEAAQVREALSSVKHKILVLSGKGGVGKSTVASQIAWGLCDAKLEVGVLDIDICGPSMPRMLGVEGEQVHKSGSGWSPVMAEDNLSLMSVAFLLHNKDDAIIWRGPRKTGLIKQFLTDVDWGELDYLVVDAPPGTSDEHISIAKFLSKAKIDGALIVTTPQEMALLDVRKEINFCKKTKIPILGVVENMSIFACPQCGHETRVYPPVSGGAEKMCRDMGIPYLGAIPMDPNILEACEKGVSFLSSGKGSQTSAAKKAFRSLLSKITKGAYKETDKKDSMTIEENNMEECKSGLSVKKRLKVIQEKLAAMATAPNLSVISSIEKLLT